MHPSASPHPTRSRGALIGGLMLVLLGLIFLLQNLNLIGRGFNWWALFILIPAFGSLWGAWEIFSRNGGRFTSAVRAPLGGGLIILTVAVMFLLDLDWSDWWPLMVAAPGVAIALSGWPDAEASPAAAGFQALNLWLGGAAVLLGLTFLADNLGVISLRETFDRFPWWGLFIAIPGVGALVNAAWLFMRQGGMSRAVGGLAIIGLCVCATAVVALLGLSWQLLAPVLLIVAGVAVLFGLWGR